MLTEVSSCSLEDWDEYARGLSKSFSSPFPWHERIFSQTDHSSPMKHVTISNSPNQEEEKIRKTFGTSPVAADLRGRADLIFEWGGKDGPSWSASASATARDDHGNEVEVKAEVHDDGTGKVALSGAHDSNGVNEDSQINSRDK